MNTAAVRARSSAVGPARIPSTKALSSESQRRVSSIPAQSAIEMPGFDLLIAYDFITALSTNFLVKERAEALRGELEVKQFTQQMTWIG
jgi:hypothetical protein